MQKIFTLIISVFFVANIFAQETKLYNPQADAASDIANAVKKAKEEHKFVLLQAGGNWCSWCIEFARFCKADPSIDSIIKNNFIWYHLNYSKENKNTKIFAQYGYPQRFGFPVFIVLDENGQRIHTQNSEYLEDGKKSYDKNKVVSFLEQWGPGALEASKYGE
jgi:thioredoxin-related protein